VVPTSKAKVSPYSVIDIAPIQQQLVSEQSGPPSSPPANESERDFQDVPSSPGLPFGYSVPVPCGYATPSNVPVIRPTYTTPVIIRHFSMDEDGKKRWLFSSVTLSFFSLCWSGWNRGLPTIHTVLISFHFPPGYMLFSFFWNFAMRKLGINLAVALAVMRFPVFFFSLKWPKC